MDATPYIPIIAEATRFVFGEVGKWLDVVRQRSKKASTDPSTDVVGNTPKLTQREFNVLQANPRDLEATINAQLAETNAYVIRGLVDQIQTHRRNLVDLEATEAEFGPLTPQHVKRGIEREADAIVEKSAHLKGLLEQVYGRRIESA